MKQLSLEYNIVHWSFILNHHLIALDRSVNVTHEEQARLVPDGAEQQKPTVTNNGHVSEVVRALQKARHVASQMIIIERVTEDRDRGTATAQHRTPPPFVVFRGELKVRQRNRHKRRDEDENDEDDEEYAINRVHLVSPNRSENVEQLDVNSAEWQEARDAHLRNRRAVPWQRRDVARILRCSHRRVELCLGVFTGYASDDGERNGDDGPKQDDEYDGTER